MKKIIFFCLFSLLSLYAQSADYIVSGTPGTPDTPGTLVTYSDNLAGTDVEKVYLLSTRVGVTITYRSEALSVKFYRYTTSLADKEPITDPDELSISTNGGVSTYTLSNLADSKGYFVVENGEPKNAIWIIDYSLHQPVFNSFETVDGGAKCEELGLYINKSDKLFFYAKKESPIQRNIPRTYTLSYDALQWDASARRFVSTPVSTDYPNLGADITLSAPLKDTYFTLRGDQFGAALGMVKEISTPLYKAVAVEPHMTYEQQSGTLPDDGGETSGLGGSAPVTIFFNGYGNEPVVAFYTWFIYAKNNMETPIARFTDRDIRYTFNSSGDHIAVLEVADIASNCVKTISQNINISESELKIPNYFSPGNPENGSPEFRVVFKSLIQFKCTIFNRWGVKLYEWTDPAQGWDGRYKGKFVSPGVYFYVIEAKGSDGKQYKKAGDINILGRN